MIHTYTKTAVRIGLILGVVGLLAGMWLEAGAFGTTFATNSGSNALELTIDSKTYYNNVLQPQLSWALKNLTPSLDHFFWFTDVKPGDTGKNSISIHVAQQSAWACLDFKNLTQKENGINEPESLVDTNALGELAGELEFFAWRDDGDYSFEIGEAPLFGTSTQSAVQVFDEKTYPLADFTHPPAYAVNQTKYIGIIWCAGNLGVNLTTAQVTCDGKVMGNKSQTDSMSVDVSIRAVSSAQQPKFTCTPTVVPPAEQCEIEGHKYDQNGKPLANWTIGLSKTITHNKGKDVYDLATAVTDENGYYCLEWDGASRTLRPGTTSTYKSGPYTFVYGVYEKLQTGWKNVSVEKGPDYLHLGVVAQSDIKKEGVYVTVPMGVPNGYIFANAAYHIDFYNQLITNKSTREAWRKVAKHQGWDDIKKTSVDAWKKLLN